MMKIKNPYIAIVAIFILGISVYSCRKELMDDQVALDPKISWANEYFKTSLLPNEGNVVDAHNYVNNVLQANLMSKKKENHKIPIWQKAMEGRTADYEFVEVPLKYTTKVTPMLYRSTSNSPQTADKSILRASLDRLIIYKKRNGNISQRIITFIPTKAYLDRHNGDISHNRINKLDKDFDGVLIYRKWSGAFESALIVKNGKGFKRVLLTKFAPKFKKASFDGDDELCGTFDVLEWFVDCEYEGDNPVPISCSEPYYEVIGQIDIPCPEDDPDYDPCLEPENFELCFPEGSEGGGGGNEEDDASARNKIIAETEPKESTNNTVSSNFLEISPDGKTRKESYQWSIAGNPLSGYVVWSHETGTHKKVGNDWVWQALDHDNFSVDNKPSYMEVTVTLNGQAIPVLGTTVAGITVKCNIQASIMFKGSPVGYPATDFIRNSPVFYIHP